MDWIKNNWTILAFIFLGGLAWGQNELKDQHQTERLNDLEKREPAYHDIRMQQAVMIEKANNAEKERQELKDMMKIMLERTQ